PGEELEVTDEPRGREPEVVVDLVHLPGPLVGDHRARGRPAVRREDDAVLAGETKGRRSGLNLTWFHGHAFVGNGGKNPTASRTGASYLSVGAWLARAYTLSTPPSAFRCASIR